jgi:hypothetical protein
MGMEREGRFRKNRGSYYRNQEKINHMTAVRALKTAVAAIAVLVLASGLMALVTWPASAGQRQAAAIPGAQVITVPYCQRHPPADLCLESVGMHIAGGATRGGDVDVISGVNLKTVHRPKHLEIKVQLWYKTLDGWLAYEYRIYTVHDLPAVGHKGWLHPGVRSECADGKWELVMTFLGITSKGTARLESFYWPASRTKKDKVLASDTAHGVPSKYWKGWKFRCLKG